MKVNNSRMQDRVVATKPTNHSGFLAFLLVLAFLCAAHTLYFHLSNEIPSWDEADYLQGALRLATGLQSGTWSGAWNGFLVSKIEKAPLVCVLPGVVLTVTNSLTLALSLPLVLTFAGLGLASYSLFRNCFLRSQAAAAATIFVCMPLTTGLTHRLYAESLLLLLIVVALDLLARFGWRTIFGSVAVGCALGLGLLCKISFPIYLGPSMALTLWMDFRLRKNALYSPLRTWVTLSGNVLIGIATAAVIAGPWYARNLNHVLLHTKISVAARAGYPGWIAADLSGGPSLIVAAAALIGLPLVLWRLIRGGEHEQFIRTWSMLLVLGLTTALGLAASPNKTVRYQVSWLPLFAALAVVAWDVARPGIWRRVGFIGLAAVGMLLSLHNSFHVLPFDGIRWGDWRFIDCSFPLNIPSWFDDNHPVDRREFRLAEAERRIAADAATRFKPGYSAQARTIQEGLLINHYYFDLLSSAQGHSVRYLFWNALKNNVPEAPDYIVFVRGFETFYPGLFVDHYPMFMRDLGARSIPYAELFQLEGPPPTQILVFVRTRT